MRLKSLNIKGFKSFADETEIYFNENLIGIVGPNGSGKSNIVDSIRWVLGEQKTTELRLDSMSDVLFNGTKTRKQGRVARVTLTFDNTKNILPTDFNEVSISRILYRDGNSEYRLNNVICRKKDITSLFLDSGIGSHSYAIISLNMVEDILHDNSGSRRYMIEQAAGISKYKLRKKETLSKLKSAFENLERVSDLLFEIQKNMSSFERQAKRTEKYNLLKAEYKSLAINIAKIEIVDISSILKELRAKLQKESDAKVGLENNINQKNALLEKLKLGILESEKSLNKDQQNFNKLIEKLGSTENNKNLLNQGVVNSKTRLNDIKNSLSGLVDSERFTLQQLESVQEQIKVHLLELDEAEKNNNQSEQHYQTLQNIYQDLRLQEKKIKDEVAAQQQVKSNAERELESYRTKVNLLTNDISVITDRIKDYTDKQGSIQPDFELHNNELDILSNKLSESGHTIEQLVELENKKTVAINKGISKKSKTELEKSSINQRIQFLENVIENNEGVPESNKFLLERDKSLTLMTDIIEVTDESYTAIIELFLESYLHHLIADNQKQAISYYEQVKSAQKGKIKVYVLDEIKTEQNQKREISKLKKVSDYVKCDKKFNPLVNQLCKDAWIFDGNIRELESLELYENQIILCKNDYIIVKSGEIYGGSNTLFEGVQLGRKQILEKLKILKNRHLSDIEKLTINIDNEVIKKSEITTQITEYRNQRKSIQVEIQKKQQTIYQLESAINSHSENINQLERQYTEKSNILAQAISNAQLKETYLSELRGINLDILTDDELSTKISTIYKEISLAAKERDEKQHQLYNLRGRHQILLKEEEYHKVGIKNLINRKDKLTSEESELSISLGENKIQLVEIEESLSSLYQERKALQAKLNSYEDSYYKEKGKIYEQEKELNQLRSHFNQNISIINALNEKISSTQFDLKAIHDRNEIEFGFRINDVNLDEEFSGLDANELKLHKSKIQDKLRGFGEINPMAITAYNEIKNRYELINKEKEDIESAKISLEDTIAEIEVAASQQFNESLDQIRLNFRNVFQSLFSDDDDCDIVLMDTDDPLEARIEIIAKPKGKKPRSINQLSGGEKTLTAASFLFALYLLKPAPFCIFDEVDAPLDDVNVQKFNKIIRQFSKDSQFIIITHNKLTMAEVDILYGVFLKEHGVSGMSAVDFRTYEPAELLEQT